MGFKVTVKMDLPDADTLIRNVGLDLKGPIQRFHDQNVLRRIQRYMPMQTGAFIKGTVINTVVGMGEIISVGPHAAYLYYGKVMVNAKTGKGPPVIPDVGPRWKKGTMLKATDRDLKFDKTKNPQAGSKWDLRLVAAEGDAITTDLQRYIDYLARRNK